MQLTVSQDEVALAKQRKDYVFNQRFKNNILPFSIERLHYS